MQIETKYLSSLCLKFLVILFLACPVSEKAWTAELQPGEKAQIYILLDFDGDSGFSSITWQHRSNGLNAFTPDPTATFNAQGNLAVLVSTDGNRYTVIGDSFARTFSSSDQNNVHQ